MMAEWHIYASGPCKTIKKNGKKHAKYWVGNGNQDGKKNVDKVIKTSSLALLSTPTGKELNFVHWSIFSYLEYKEVVAFYRFDKALSGTKI